MILSLTHTLKKEKEKGNTRKSEEMSAQRGQQANEGAGTTRSEIDQRCIDI